ncbi:TetR/AcrR family transcriptional regulator [Roseobacter sp. YSTF-M11]|uniref:TetR/AcrR family transcriptional regulator n=1 Tax=Roseobacter insulae TaxID=2859783 RepID=A0A9X1FZ24_9RHOB|nr:TetR/AcrR family transcriptional regulator [Roseobacter insulae]MBW4710840.1 TetR/AcrR family transcriptional regulator [Roseobacter insulae]
MAVVKKNAKAADALPYKERKTRDILVAARKLFFEHGVEAVTIEEIAEAAGVAKTTIYYKFGRKEDVFAAVFDQLGEDAVADFPGEIDRNACPRETLLNLCRQLVTALANRELMGPEPLFLLEAKRKPELGRKFFEMGPGRMRTALQDLIQMWVDQGKLQVEDTKEAAEDLSVLCQGLLPIELQIFPDLKLSEEEIEHRVTRGVDKFLKIYGAARG